MSITKILQGIDRYESAYTDGWWETSSGAKFGRLKLVEAQGYEDGLLGRITELEAQLAAVQADAERNCESGDFDTEWQNIEADGSLITHWMTPTQATHSRSSDMTSWEKSSIWKKRLNGFCSYQYAAWMALFVPIQVDLAMREVLNEQFSFIAGEAK